MSGGLCVHLLQPARIGSIPHCIAPHKFEPHWGGSFAAHRSRVAGGCNWATYGTAMPADSLANCHAMPCHAMPCQFLAEHQQSSALTRPCSLALPHSGRRSSSGSGRGGSTGIGWGSPAAAPPGGQRGWLGGGQRKRHEHWAWRTAWRTRSGRLHRCGGDGELSLTAHDMFAGQICCRCLFNSLAPCWMSQFCWVGTFG